MKTSKMLGAVALIATIATSLAAPMAASADQTWRNGGNDGTQYRQNGNTNRDNGYRANDRDNGGQFRNDQAPNFQRDDSQRFYHRDDNRRYYYFEGHRYFQDANTGDRCQMY